MKALLQQYGLLSSQPRSPVSLPVPLGAAQPVTTRIPLWVPVYGTPYQQRKAKRSPQELKLFSESVLPSRAINLIRKSITGLNFGVQAKDAQKQKNLRTQIDMVRSFLDNINTDDHDFRTFLGPIIEDVLVFDAGCWEYVESPEYMIENPYLALEVVPGYTIARNVKWAGDPTKPKWAQVLEGKQINAELLDAQIEYIMQRKRSYTSFGLSPLEVAMDIMDSWVKLSSYQRNVASESYPAFMFYFGEEATQEMADKFRVYWENTCLGRGTPGVFGGMGKEPKTMEMKTLSDDGLYLKYQESLMRVLAFSFDLKPQDFGLERDVNRSTSEVSMSASIREAIRPMAEIVANRMNRRVIPRLAIVRNDPSINEVEFFWQDLSIEDAAKQSAIHKVYLEDDVLTIDEVRADLDYDPLDGDLGKMTLTAYRAAVGGGPLPATLPDGNPPEPALGETIPAATDLLDEIDLETETGQGTVQLD